MKRREFLKKSILFTTVTGFAVKAGLLPEAFADDKTKKEARQAKKEAKKEARQAKKEAKKDGGDVYVTEGKLGYKEVSPKAKMGRTCGTCEWYKNAKDGVGECTLAAMKSAMKAKVTPKVKEGAYCNMWKAIKA